MTDVYFVSVQCLYEDTAAASPSLPHFVKKTEMGRTWGTYGGE